jgi:hypothetical protein
MRIIKIRLLSLYDLVRYTETESQHRVIGRYGTLVVTRKRSYVLEKARSDASHQAYTNEKA